VSAVEKFFASLKRLLEPRTPPSAERMEQPTADRPPPQAEVMPDVGLSDDDLVIPPDDDLEEVRAALQAVSQAPDPTPTPAPALLFPAAIEEVVEAPVVEGPTPASERIGDALVLTLGAPSPLTFTVAKTSATLGRGQENTIRLDDLSVSRRHARIAYRQGGYWLSDLGSMGGTWVDGTRLNAPRRIAAGEVIDIGLCRLTVSFAGGAAKAGTKKGAGKPQSEIAGQVRRRR
jgi:FHA domain-containing protein